MTYYPNVDALYLFKRAKDEYLKLTEYKTVKYKRVTLREIPDSTASFTIKSNGTTLTKVTTDPNTNTQYKVDYTNGQVFFYTGMENKTVEVTYTGMGMLNIPANRIMINTSETNNEEVSIQDILDRQQDILSVLGSGEGIVRLSNDLNTRAINVLYPPAPLVAAKGDFITDDTAAIQACIDYAKASSLYKSVFIPRGIYLISGKLVTYSDITIYGEGSTSVLKLKNNANNKIDILSVDGLENTNVTIKSLKIDGNKENQVASNETTCLRVQGIDNLLIQDVVITGGLIEGIYCYKSKNVRVINVNAIGNGFKQADASGIHIDTCEKVSLQNCITNENGFHGLIFSSVKDSSVSSHFSDNNGWDGFRVQYETRNVKIDQFTSTTNFRGIYFTTDSQYNTVSNSQFNNNLTNGIVFNNSYNNLLNFTFCQDNAEYGLMNVEPWDNNYAYGLMMSGNALGTMHIVGGSVLNYPDKINPMDYGELS